MRVRQIAFRLIGLVVLALILRQLDLAATGALLTHLEWPYLAIALAATPLLFGLKAWRWHTLLQMQGIEYPWRDVFLAFTAALFLGLVTPGRLGEMSKVLYLKQDRNVPIGEGLASVLFDRLFDLYVILLLGTAGLVGFALLPSWADALVLAVTAAALALPVVLVNGKMASRSLDLVRKFPFAGRFHPRLVTSSQLFQSGLRRLLVPRIVFPAALTAGAYLLYFAQARLLASALQMPIGIVYLSMCLSVAGVITLLPISFSGLGTRDAVLILLFGAVGITAEAAVAFSTLFFVTFYLGGGLLGTVAWQIKPLEERA